MRAATACGATFSYCARSGDPAGISAATVFSISSTLPSFSSPATLMKMGSASAISCRAWSRNRGIRAMRESTCPSRVSFGAYSWESGKKIPLPISSTNTVGLCL